MAFVLAGLSAGGARIAWLVAGALLVPARLVANLLDGLVAVEGGLGGKSGEIYNELPKFPKVKKDSAMGGPKGFLLSMVERELAANGFTEEQVNGGGLKVA